MVSIIRVCLWFGCIAFPFSATCTAQELSREDFFESRVRPLLLERCSECHGAESQWAELRVDSREALLRGGEHGPAIVPGKPKDSLLITAVERSGEIQMPPEDQKPLTPQEVNTLKTWIEDGAYWPTTSADSPQSMAAEKERKWKEHWAFQPVQHPTPPALSNADAYTPVDQFITQQLAKHGLQLAPLADRRTLIRRLYFDLIGLPPTIAEVNAFLADEDPAAYSNLVDRLLDTQAYGEHWGRLWLDVARYSDTKGYVYGREEKNFIHAYPYRDWVCEAFTRDLPYDRFLQLQLAADQLTEPGHPDRAAMGFLTLGRRFLGVSHDIIDDRIDTISRGLMGITVSCARCHDHKYDPVPTADYYSLYGVFLNSSERIERLNSNQSSSMETPEKETPENWEAELVKRQETLAQRHQQARAEASQRMRQRIKDYFIAQSELEKYPQEGFDQILATTDLIPNLVRRLEMLLTATQLKRDPRFIAWHAYAALPKEQFSNLAVAETAKLQTLSDTEIHPKVRILFSTSPATFREVTERYGQLFFDIETQWNMLLQQSTATGTAAPTALADPVDELLRQFLYDNASPCFIPDEHISSIEGLFDSGTCTELWKLQGDVDRWILQPNINVPFATLLVDRQIDYPAQILRRGNPAQKGSIVARHLLSILDPSLSEFRQGSGRLELARSTTDRSNPLTARVWVNRVWKQHFGHGLVRTPSDFGLRAESPSHPELLDWLASEFMTNGWSTKKLHRWIVLSQTYQQTSQPNYPADYLRHANGVDPDNRLLWRYTPRRLSFEMMRDSWLSVTGELSPTFGGRAGELFASPTTPQRRTLYASIDRQFVPGVLRMFDYANPDMHAPQRSETTVPQQALFSLNHPFVAERAKELIRKLHSSHANFDERQRIEWLFERVLQRKPNMVETEALLKFLASPDLSTESTKESVKAWSYGYGEIVFGDKPNLTSFTPLPYFNGNSWQGGSSFPDGKLGWVRVTSDGGHPGNDHQHAAVRRWTSPLQGTIKLKSLMEHQEAVGDGVRCSIISSRHGLLATENVHHRTWNWDSMDIQVQPGDTIDFVVDILQELNTDQYLWQVSIQASQVDQNAEVANPTAVTFWNSLADFHGPPTSLLSRWEQAAQILLVSNELLFVE
jgi:hypothetical protein